jgi:cyclophilin family peptidyl-prolyl cis-trans isomerase
VRQESELTPSGANLLDGRYAVFGYVVEGQELLQQLQARAPRSSSQQLASKNVHSAGVNA